MQITRDPGGKVISTTRHTHKILGFFMWILAISFAFGLAGAILH